MCGETWDRRNYILQSDNLDGKKEKQLVKPVLKNLFVQENDEIFMSWKNTSVQQDLFSK